MELHITRGWGFFWGGGDVLSLKPGCGRHFPVATPSVHSSCPALRSYLCPTCHRSFLSLPCLPLALGPASLPLEVCSCCPTQDTLLWRSPPHLPEGPHSRSSRVSKEDSVSQSPVVFTMRIPGVRLQAGPCTTPVTNGETSHTDRVCYRFYTVRGNRMCVKLLLCRKISVTSGAVREQDTLGHADRFFGLAKHRIIFTSSSGEISLVPIESFCQVLGQLFKSWKH